MPKPMRIGVRGVIVSDPEQRFLTVGKAALRAIIRDSGGTFKASKISGASFSSLTRWLEWETGRPVGKVFGRSHLRSLWPGYPSPFPAFDKILYEIEERSYLELLLSKWGYVRTHRELRRGVALDLVDVDWDEVIRVSRELGVPKRTFTRWSTGLSYPMSWRALDVLTKKHRGCSWLEYVMTVDLEDLVHHEISDNALAALVHHLAKRDHPLATGLSSGYST